MREGKQAIVFIGERYLFRYGADRSILELAKKLESESVNSYFAGIDFSTPPTEFTNRVIRIPRRRPQGQTNSAKEDLFHHIENVARNYKKVHCVVWSWPFIHLLRDLEAVCDSTTFIDFGVVPTTGYSPKHKKLIESLIHSRREFIGFANHKMAISNFIAESQTIPDGGTTGVYVNYLGSDHAQVPSSDFRGSNLEIWQRKKFLPVLRDLRDSRESKIIFSLGRYEPFTYKNSEFTDEIVEHLPQNHFLLRLGGGDRLGSHGGMAIDIGHPTDAELFRLMKESNLTISTSKWEGFNLPLAESGRLGTKSWCFKIGAHPEVVGNHDRLFSSKADFLEALKSEIPNIEEVPEMKRFTWEKTALKFSASLFVQNGRN